MSTFARHRVVLNEKRGETMAPPFQLQVSVDGGEIWYDVVLKDEVVIAGGKHVPLHAAVTLPLWSQSLEDGALGSIVEGEHLPYEQPL